MEPKNKSKLPVLTMLLVALLVLVGTSYAYFDYSFIGKDNTISTTDVSIKLLESNKEIVTLENQLPMSDEQGINQVGTGNVFDFAVETKSSSDMKLGYKLNIEKLKADTGYTSLTDDQIKIYLTDTNDNKILGPLKISQLENYNLYEDVNIHSKTNNTQVDKYRIRVWIDQDVQIKDWDENTKQQYKFKIGVGSTENEGSYIITYNSNGGEGQMAASIYNKNTTNTLRKNTFTRGGYTFKGWSTTNNGEVEYQDQNTATNLTQNQNDQNKTLYAVWKPNTYTVKYYPNTKEIRTEEDVTIDVDYYPESGENPYKWQLNNGVYESSDTPSSSGEPQSYSKTSNTKSLANEYIKSRMYKEISLSEEKQLEFDCAMTYGILKIYIRGEGGKYLDSVTINYNELIEGEYNPIVITLPKETRYIEFYYTDEPNGGAPAAYQEDDENSPITKKLETTTAIHKAYIKNIKLTTNGNNGIKTSTFTVGQNNKLLTSTYTKTGHTFKGWHTNKNETTIKYQDESDLTEIEKTVKEQDQIDLYAIWETNKYNVNVIVQNGTINGDSTKQIEYNKNGTFNLVPTESDAVGTVTCTNNQNGTINNNILTINNVTNDTTCTVKFVDSVTTLYTDGTLIINEALGNRNTNIETHGAVTNEYEAMSESNSYVMTDNTQLWKNKRKSIKSIEIGRKITPISTAYWFYSLSWMKKGDFTNLDTSKVTDMSSMFYDAGYNATTFNLNLSNWNTSSVTNMSSMFGYAGNYSDTINLNLSGWSIQKVTNIKDMFKYAGKDSTTFSLNLSNWNASSVTDMSYMFDSAGKNATTWNIGNLSNWDVSKVTDMSSMFSITNAGSSATTWNIGDISNWDVSKVTNMKSMFSNAGSSATTWNIGDLSNWDVSKVTDMSSMFYQAGSSATTWSIGNLSKWNTSSVTNMNSMFKGAGNSATTWSIGNLSKWNTSKATDMRSMFSSAGSSATTWNIGDISSWDVSKVTDMRSMFNSVGQNSTTWSIGNLSKWNTSSVTNMSGMFNSAGKNATTWNIGDLSTWDVSKVTDMSSMFNSGGQKSATWNIGNLSGWNTSSVTDMSSMFYSAGLRATTFNLNLSSWDVSKVTDMSDMFNSAGLSATTFNLDLSKWNTSSVTNMRYMFYCAGQNSTTFNLNLSNWNTSSVTNMSSMFNAVGYKATSWSVTIPKTTGSLTNTTSTWYGSSESTYASPDTGKSFTLAS